MDTEQPLSGVRIIDLTIAMAGPLATQRLADFGADVVKVEVPPDGDLTRAFALNNVRLGEDTTSYISLNRNKRSIVVNLKSNEGRELLYGLIRDADVFIQNFRPGVAKRLGMDHETVRALNPRLIYASITGYGNTGPLVSAPGQDLLAQAFSGLMFSGGKASDGPHPSPCYMADAGASHLITSGILAGLYQREKTGKGTYVETSLLGGLLEMQSQEVMTYLATGESARRCDAPYASAWLDPPYGVYKTDDGWLAFAQNDLNVIAGALELPALAECNQQRPESLLSDDGVAWRERCYRILAAGLETMKTDEAMKILSAQKVWCMPVNTYGQAIDHPQTAQFLSSFERSDHGDIRCVAPVVQVGQNTGPDQPLRPAPRLGEHTREVLIEAGYAASDIDRLFEAEVIS